MTIFDKIESWNISVTNKWGPQLLRYSLAIIYGWFGILKPFGLSPASELVADTVFWFSHTWFVPFLGVWEVAICVLLLFRPTVKYAVFLIFLHLPGTFLPLFILPDTSFVNVPLELTLIGQYIIKNLTLAAAAIVAGGSPGRPKKEQAEAKRKGSYANGVAPNLRKKVETALV